MNRHPLLVTGLCLILTTPVSAAKKTIGWVENVRITPGDIVLKAKIDTGAKTSSLHCDYANITNRKGQKWVRITLTDDHGKTVQIERKIERIGNIKRHFDNLQQRPVVKLGLCLGRTYKETEVNLVDRRGMNYQMLIGRRFLKHSYLIDPALTFTRQPDCKQGSGGE